MEKEQKQPEIMLNTPEEMGVMQVSRWQEYHVQFDGNALEELIGALGILNAYRVGVIVPHAGWVIPLRDIVASYKAFWVQPQPETARWRSAFSFALSADPSAFFARQLQSGYLLTPKIPYIQVRLSTYTVTNEGKVLPGVLGNDVIPWGLQFSYPLLFMNSKEGIAKNVLTEDGFFNTPLFKELQRWIRRNTKPAKIEVGGRLIQTTMRCTK